MQYAYALNSSNPSNVSSLTKLAKGLSTPSLFLKRILRIVPGLPLEVKVDLDLFDRPSYAYGMYRAALEARALGISRITAIEFGVASGRGLLAAELIAAEIERSLQVAIEIVGFDLREGLPNPSDYRDLPYLYRGGYYKMDEERLTSMLSRSELVIGDVRDTVPAFLESDGHSPIGFIAFDLDYYSSTKSALGILDGADKSYLPRILCYFDDIANVEALQSEYTGELLAVQEFNDQHEDVKIARITGFAASRSIPSLWNDQMYVCHLFGHSLYNVHVVEGAAGYVQPLGPRTD